MPCFVAFLQSTYINTAVTGDNWSDSFSIVGQFFSLILAFGFVLILAYYSTKWLANVKNIRQSNSNLKIIEGLSVGYQTHIQLIRVGEKYILIGVSKDKITFLTEIDATDIITAGTENNMLAKVPFEKYLNKYFKINKDS